MKNAMLRALACLFVCVLLLGTGRARADGVTAEPSVNTVFVDGKEVKFDAYMIEGRNYVQLRELGEATGFAVDWDQATNNVLITTKTPAEPADAVTAAADAQELKLDAVLVNGEAYVSLDELARLDAVRYAPGTRRLTFTDPLRAGLEAKLAQTKRAAWILGGLFALALLLALYLLRRREEEAPDMAATKVTTYVQDHLVEEPKEPEESAEPAGAAAAGGGAEETTGRVIDEICRSVLPQPLKKTPASAAFSLAGGVQEGQRYSCAFYDHFYVGENTLCLVVAQVPGSGIAEALRSVVTQTAIRSRLRMGRSLTETMSDVNSQLYDLGGVSSVCALVGVLNVMNGSLSFVNAGGGVPYLMRGDGRYELLRSPVYAPLGETENVTYRDERLRLTQGDRLFLYTTDLEEMEDENGTPFGGEALATALNLSREKTRSMDEMLRFLRDEAASFCASEESLLSYASIALEYRKGNKDYVFTTVPGTTESAPAVTQFVRRTMESGGIDQRVSAKQILLADELFNLCCHSCAEGAEIKVECAIRQIEKTVHMRMLAPLGGVDPLERGEDDPGRSAAEYIRAHAKRCEFQAGIDRDMVEVVSPIG